MLDLRPYQIEAQKAVEAEWEAGRKKTLLVLPTGTGKTIVFSHIVKSAVESGKRALILAHRDELILQAQDRLRAAVDIECGIEKASSTCLDGDFSVVVGSVQTLSRDKRLYAFSYDYFDVIVVDEAHHILADGYQKILNHFSDAYVLGVTATAERGDERELGDFFDSIAYEYLLTDAIRDGYLCPIKARTIPLKIDVSDVKLKKGDFDVTQMGTVLTPYLEAIADEMISAGCLERKTVIFLPLIKTSECFAKILSEKGFSVAEIHGTSKDRPDILKDFNDGKLNVLCNSMLLTEGWDCPSVDTIIVLRPTKIRGFYCQMIGRGTRISPGKSGLLILDFLWMTGRHELCRPADLVSSTDAMYCAITEELLQSAAALDLSEMAEVIADREAALAEYLASYSVKRSSSYNTQEVRRYHGSSFAICSSNLSVENIKDVGLDTPIPVYFEWSGNTYPVKDQIKRLGFRWSDAKWSLSEHIPLSKVAEIVRKIKATDGLYLSDDIEKAFTEIKEKAKNFYEKENQKRTAVLRKLQYRVLMDKLGATPRAIAKLMGCSKNSPTLGKIDSWIDPNSTACPAQHDLDFICALREKQLKEVESIMTKAVETRDKKGVTTVRLPYYMSQKECIQHWRMANATLRLAAEKLESEGFFVEFISTDEANDRIVYEM